MKAVLSIFSLVFLLTACTTSPESSTELKDDGQSSTESVESGETVTDQVEDTVFYQGSGYSVYIPSDWVAEAGFLYSPVTIKAKADGPYSLYIKPSKFADIEEYLSESEYAGGGTGLDCTSQKKNLSLNGYNTVQFTASCANGEPVVTLIDIDGNLFEAYSYLFDQESEEINKILDSIKL